MLSWFSRPGTASAFTPNTGIVQECKTSAAVIITRVGVDGNSTNRWSASRRRKGPSFIMYASNDKSSPQSLYSYDQYHWCPITLIFIEGIPTSSRRYNNRSLGNPIANSTKQGNVVHSISVDCDSSREVFIIFLVREIA